MRKYLFLSLFISCSLVGSAQQNIIVKVGVGASVPFGKLEDSETQELTKLVKTGVNLGLSVGHDITKKYGIAATVLTWGHEVRNDRMAEYMRTTYIPEAYQPFVTSLRTSSEKFRFTMAYVSPYYTVQPSDRLRLDFRLNLGVMFMRFPAITGQGTGKNPLENLKEFPLAIVTESGRSSALTYGAGFSAYYKIDDGFNLFFDADGLRGRPKFDAINVEGGLGGSTPAKTISLNTTRAAFQQTAGTLSLRVGVAIFL